MALEKAHLVWHFYTFQLEVSFKMFEHLIEKKNPQYDS